MIKKWIIVDPPPFVDKPQGCIIALPGRGVPARVMEDFCRATELWRTKVICLEPWQLEWYPQPKGPQDQSEAVAGQSKTTKVLLDTISWIEKTYDIPVQEMCVLGFSAGGVMTLQLVAHSHASFKGAVCMGGAILDPESMPKAPTQTPILIQHNMDDDCFDWDERFLPMKRALWKQGYNFKTEERFWGGHTISIKDAEITGRFLGELLGYSNNEIDSIGEKRREEEAKQALQEDEDEDESEEEYEEDGQED
jgi:predicted esterase